MIRSAAGISISFSLTSYDNATCLAASQWRNAIIAVSGDWFGGIGYLRLGPAELPLASYLPPTRSFGTSVVRYARSDCRTAAIQVRRLPQPFKASQEPFTAWLRRRIDRDCILVEPKLYPSRGTAGAIREQGRQRHGRIRGAIKRQRPFWLK